MKSSPFDNPSSGWEGLIGAGGILIGFVVALLSIFSIISGAWEILLQAVIAGEDM